MRGWPQIKTGRYEIPAQASPQEILRQLAEGRVVLETLTVIEGWTFADMRRVVEAHPQIKVTLRGKEIADIMSAIGHAGEHPEGRFFPDTYRFAAGTTDRDLYRAGVSQDGRDARSAWSARAAALPLANAYEALTLASIVEKETGLASERPRIAGVFTTRLRRNMRLQTDPTVIYGLGAAYDGNIRERDLRTDTPYNTYTRGGLPPTPIALPSREAIEAVTRPLETGDIFFVATGIGDGSHVFSATLEAHNAAVARYLARLRGARVPDDAGEFITLEGIEGAGKTTVADRLTQSLRARGITVHATREPGGTKVAERVRALVLERGEEHISATAETLLMFGARQVHVDNLIRPALTRGEWVLCDRFTDATHAYQGGGRGVDRKLIDQIAQAVHGDLNPDCTHPARRAGARRPRAHAGATRRRRSLRNRVGAILRSRAQSLPRTRARASRAFPRRSTPRAKLDQVCEAALAALEECLELAPVAAA